MNPKEVKLYEFGVELPESICEAAGELLVRLGGSSPVLLYSKPEDGLPMPKDIKIDYPRKGFVRLTSYFTNEPTDAEIKNIRREVEEFINKHFKKIFSGELVFSGRRMADSDWKTVWQRYYKPRKIGRKLAVSPPWELGKAQKLGREIIIINPGVAFGTGQHETTTLCMELIEDYADAESETGSMLDVGCGSAVLMIAASKLGFAKLAGVDVEDDAVEEAKTNLKVNRVKGTLKAASAAEIKGTFDLVAANILLEPLLVNAEEIAAAVKPGGALVMSGVTTEQSKPLAEKYEGIGFKLTKKRRKNGWAALLMTKKA